MAISVPSAAGAATPVANGGAGASSVSTAGLLGLHDPELDDLKQAAVSVFQQQARTKHPKFTHSLFFDDDKGLSKVVQSFPRIRFQGKGREFDDLKLLVRHYEKWFKDLLPCDDHFEDLVWKARTVLQEKERHEDGTVSDPREQLHHIRLRYKTLSGLGTRGEQEKRTSASVAPQKEQQSSISDELRKRLEENRNLDVETLWRIEEKRAKALELKRKRREEAATQDSAGGTGGRGGAGGGAVSSQTQGSRVSQEDVFGFGGGLDGSQSSAHMRVAKALSQTQSITSQEDVFGFGGGFDGSQASSTAARRGAASLQAFSQASEHDVFGFGVEMDGSQASSARNGASAAAVSGGERDPVAAQGGPGAAALSAELRSKIEANRQRALEVQRKKRLEEAAEKDRGDAPKDMDLETLLKIEEHRAKALELRRKRREQAAAKASSLSQAGSTQASVETKPTQCTQLTPSTQMTQLSQCARDASQRDGVMDATAALPADASTHRAHGPAEALESALASGHGRDGSGFGVDASQEATPSKTAALQGVTEPQQQQQGALGVEEQDHWSASEPLVHHHPQSSRELQDAFLVGMSQPDVFDFGCGLDASQQTTPIGMAPVISAQAVSTSSPSGEMQPPPPPPPPPPQHSFAAGDVLAMSQADVFGFGFDLDATQQSTTPGG